MVWKAFSELMADGAAGSRASCPASVQSRTVCSVAYVRDSRYKNGTDRL